MTLQRSFWLARHSLLVLVGLALLVLGSVAAIADPVFASSGPGLDRVAALESDAPASPAANGRFAGPPLPLFGERKPDGSGLLRSATARPVLEAVAGRSSYDFQVYSAAALGEDPSKVEPLWDSGTVSTSSATVPDGVLVDGGMYEVKVRADGADLAPTLFVVDESGTPGVVTTSVASEPYTTAHGHLALGLQFSSADLPSTAAPGAAPTAVAGAAPSSPAGTAASLPPGWSWSGVGEARYSSAETIDFPGGVTHDGASRLLKLYGPDGVEVLGCTAASGGTACDVITPGSAGEGPHAVLEPAGTWQVSDPASHALDTFDKTGDSCPDETGSDKLPCATWQVANEARPGGLASTVTYRTVAGQRALDTVGLGDATWKVRYGAECSGVPVPPGFVTAPAGLPCGWSTPSGETVGLLYTQPQGAAPRLGRALQYPAGCASYAACDATDVQAWDFGWDSHGRLAAARSVTVLRAVRAGLVDQGDTSLLTAYAYDDATNALTSVTAPAPQPGGARQLETYSYTTAPASDAPALLSVTATAGSTAKGAGALTTAEELDAGLRPIVSRAADGAVTKQVWAATKNLLLAKETPDGMVAATVYDTWDRPVSTYSGPASAFDLAACSIDSPNRTNLALCQPRPGTSAQVTSTTTRYDEPAQAGSGLDVAYWGAAHFEGTPTAHSFVHAQPPAGGGTNRFTLAPPAAAGADWSARLSGSLVPTPQEDGTYNVEIDVPEGTFTDGVVYVDGRYCTRVSATTQSCTLQGSDDTASQPRELELDLSHDPSATGPATVAVSLSPPDGSFPTSADSIFVPRWGAATTATATDPTPAGGHDPVVATAAYRFDDPASTSATQVVVDPGGVAQKTTEAFQDDGHGGSRLAAITRPAGNVTSFTYWGDDDTPAHSSLPHTDELPADVRGAAQGGFVESTNYPSPTTGKPGQGGRVVTTAYDSLGRPACTQVDGGNWSCRTYDADGFVASETQRGDDGQPGIDVTVTHPTPLTTTFDANGANATRDTTVVDYTGRTSSYTDANGTTTAYTYDALGRLASENVQPPATSKGTPGPVTLGYGYDSLGRPATTSVDGTPVASVAYDQAHPDEAASVTYPHGVLTTFTHDAQGRPTGQDWVLPGQPAALHDTATRTNGGRLWGESFDTANYAFTYDTANRLSAATVGPDQYRYTWGPNDNLLRQDVTTPQGSQAITYTTNAADQVVAVDGDPNAALPTDPAKLFDHHDDYLQVGSETYTYDANDQLSKAVDSATGETLTYSRDAHGRPITRTVTGGKAAGNYELLYDSPTAANAALTLAADGSVGMAVALPGNLVWGGNGATILNQQGHATIQLAADGTRDPSTPTELWSPFGQAVQGPAANNSQATPGWHGETSDLGSLADLGQRTLDTRLVTFLQPDPVFGGSQAGPYSYTAANPVSFSDLNGNSSFGDFWTRLWDSTWFKITLAIFAATVLWEVGGAAWGVAITADVATETAAVGIEVGTEDAAVAGASWGEEAATEEVAEAAEAGAGWGEETGAAGNAESTVAESEGESFASRFMTKMRPRYKTLAQAALPILGFFAYAAVQQHTADAAPPQPTPPDPPPGPGSSTGPSTAASNPIHLA